MKFENRQIMIQNLRKRNLTVDKDPNNKDIFCGTEYAGVWSYVNTPQQGKHETTPVLVELIRKYDYE